MEHFSLNEGSIQITKIIFAAEAGEVKSEVMLRPAKLGMPAPR